MNTLVLSYAMVVLGAALFGLGVALLWRNSIFFDVFAGAFLVLLGAATLIVGAGLTFLELS